MASSMLTSLLPQYRKSLLFSFLQWDNISRYKQYKVLSTPPPSPKTDKYVTSPRDSNILSGMRIIRTDDLLLQLKDFHLI